MAITPKTFYRQKDYYIKLILGFQVWIERGENKSNFHSQFLLIYNINDYFPKYKFRVWKGKNSTSLYNKSCKSFDSSRSRNSCLSWTKIINWTVNTILTQEQWKPWSQSKSSTTWQDTKISTSRSNIEHKEKRDKQLIDQLDNL